MNCEGQKFNAWLQLIFGHKLRQFTTGYGYNLENELAKHPVKEFGDQLSKESSKIQDAPSQHFRQSESCL